MRDQPGRARRGPRPAPVTIVVRLLLFAALWWALTEGDTYNLWFGAVIIVLATAASLALVPPTRLRPWHLVGLMPWFVWMSISGVVDVARRAFAPAMPLDPGMVEVPLRLPDGPERVMMANIISLTPGTVSVELLPHALRIHLLDRGMPIEDRARDLEQRVARIFAIELGDEPPVA
jgi:multicomponent Na+:H+ antiporter subunit E